MKKWSMPQISNLSVDKTESSDIIARQGMQKSDIGGGDLWYWECKCCGAKGPAVHKTEQEAIDAGIKEHGAICPNRREDGTCPIS